MTLEAALSHPARAKGWLAELELGFTRRSHTTVLDKNRHIGPLRLQRPLYPEAEVCHACILHPPGGIVGGDRLSLTAAVETGAAALITTPGATKFYRSGGESAVQENRFAVKDQGSLEWLPQECIVYPGADAATATRVDLATDGAFIGWEILCIGLPACSQPFTSGNLTAAFEIDRNGRPIFRDRMCISGQADLNRPSGLRGHTVSATLVATGCEPDLLASLRDIASATSESLTGVTLIDDVLVARYLGHASSEAKALFQKLWIRLRPAILGRLACPPRIWET